MTENKKVTPSKADEMAQIQQRIFEREVDEELRQEKLAKMWKKYRFLIIGGAIGVVLVTIASEWYGSWQQKIKSAESDRLEQALILATKGNEQEALVQFKQLGADGKTGYRYIAQMEEAALLLKTNKQRQGLEALQALAADTKAPQPIRDLAVVSYVGNRLDTGDTQKLKQMIQPLTQNENGAFYGQAVELASWLHLISGEQKEAQNLIKQALAGQNLSPQVRDRLKLLAEKK